MVGQRICISLPTIIALAPNHSIWGSFPLSLFETILFLLRKWLFISLRFALPLTCCCHWVKPFTQIPCFKSILAATVMIKGNYREEKLEFFLVRPFGRQLSLNVTKCSSNDREEAVGWGFGSLWSSLAPSEGSFALRQGSSYKPQLHTGIPWEVFTKYRDQTFWLYYLRWAWHWKFLKLLGEGQG